MKKYGIAGCFLLLSFMLLACNQTIPPANDSASLADDAQNEERSVLTIIYAAGQPEEKSTVLSFSGEEAKAITNLLSQLDYQKELCKCLPEYTTDLGYSFNLRESYARYDHKQASLTDEQVQLLQGFIDQCEISGVKG